MQCCTCFDCAHLKCSLLSFSRFRTHGSSHSWSCPPYCVLALFWRSHTYQPCDLRLLQLIYLHCSIRPIWPRFAKMQHSHPTLAFKPPFLFPLTLYFLPLHPHHLLMFLAVSVYPLLPLPLPNSRRALQWNAWGLREGALNCYILFRLIPLISFVSRNLTLIYLSLSGSLVSLLCNPMASTPDLVFFPINATDASGCVIIFVRKGLSFSNLSTSSLSSLDPYSDYVEVNISLNDSSLLSFLMFMLPLFALLRRIAEPIFFLPRFFLPM